MNTVEALKALYVALGGTAADVAKMTLIPQLIGAIAQFAAGGGIGGGGLPDPSELADGSVLFVENGEWVAEPDRLLPIPDETGENQDAVLIVGAGNVWTISDAPFYPIPDPEDGVGGNPIMVADGYEGGNRYVLSDWVVPEPEVDP